MAVILVYAALVITGQSIAFTVALAVERASPAAGILVFFAMFALTFVAAWFAAVWITERYLGRFVGVSSGVKPSAPSA